MSSRAKVLIAGAIVIVVLVGGGLWWYLKDDAPAAVSLDAAVDQVDDGADLDTVAAADHLAGGLDRRVGDVVVEAGPPHRRSDLVDRQLRRTGGEAGHDHLGQRSSACQLSGLGQGERVSGGWVGEVGWGRQLRSQLEVSSCDARSG
ncbi:MAG: hypothetical protein ABWZ55_06010, partial [Acidimicrobiales bacterium]